MDEQVLVVDDDPDAQMILRRIVEILGLHPQVASNGLEALDLLQDHEVELPSLVLLDLMMPGMNGFEVYNWLRGNPKTRQIPVVVVTACDSNQIDMFRLPGINGVIRKGDYAVDELMDMIKGILNFS